MEYKITPKIRANAKKLGVTVKPSKSKNKKLDVFDKQGKKLHSIGDIRYKDFHLYTKEKGKEFAEKRRKLYKIRHAKTRFKVGSASYFSDKILWD